MINARKVYRNAAAEGLMPDPLMTVSEWADRYRLLPQGEAEPGQWRTERTPYLREIMDNLSPSSPVQTVVFMKGAQVGGTEAGNNWIGYIMDIAPGRAMIVQPSSDAAKDFSKQRINPLISSTPRLAAKVRARSAFNKTFPGGFLAIAPATIGAALRSKPIRYLMLDEIDGYPWSLGKEGDPIALAQARTSTFARKKIFKVSTPTTAGHSRIQEAFDASDQRFFHVPCPHCGFMQPLVWNRIRYPKANPELATYQCANQECEKEIQEHQKTKMFAQGKWIARSSGPLKAAGYHLSTLYSPIGWTSWGAMAAEYEKAANAPDDSGMRSFTMTKLGEVWKEESEKPDWKRLYDNRESYPIGTVPRGGVFLTAGADVQKDRIEVEIVAWGKDNECWSVDYRHIMGDTTTESAVAFKGLDKLLQEYFDHANGNGSVLAIRVLAIDSGYNTQTVYNWARKYDLSRVIATKGEDNLAQPLGTPTPVDVTVRGRRYRRGLMMWTIGVSVLKAALYSLLRLEKPIDNEPFPDGYCHFPQYDEKYFKQLTSETMVFEKDAKGFSKTHWKKGNERNEALDCRVMAMAAASYLGIDRLTAADWAQLTIEAGGTISPPTDPQAAINPIGDHKSSPKTQEGSEELPRVKRSFLRR